METATTPMQPKPLVTVTCKLGTKGCFADGRCHALGNCENKIVTNADRIRAMSDEELCAFIVDVPAIPCDEKISAMMKENGCNDCEKCVMDWLRQPVKEEST